MAHVWNFIDTVFNDGDAINVLRGETASCSSSKRKNQNRSIGAIDPLERKKIGSKCDMIFARESCSHDQICWIIFYRKKSKVQTLGFIHSGLQSCLVRADRPTKYTTRIAKSRTYHISNDITELGRSVLPAIYIAWAIKDIVAKMDTIIAENTASNNIEDENSEWLEQYWSELDKENVPETASSQEERIPKKSKAF